MPLTDDALDALVVEMLHTYAGSSVLLPARDELDGAGVVADPGRSRPRGRSRRLLVVVCAALLAIVGLAVAGTISVSYFGASSRVPAPVERALEEQVAATHSPGIRRELALDRTVLGYAFTSGSGRGKVYMAPYADSSGFCAALEVPGKPIGARCTPSGPRPTRPVTVGESPTDLALSPDVHALLGRLPAGGRDLDAVIAFEDGSAITLPRSGRWFAYAVAGEHTTPGHRPTQLRYVENGKVVSRSFLNPVSFNTLAEARALVPRSDGSRGQDAIRSMLLAGLTGYISDGGRAASHVELAKTRLVHVYALGRSRTVTVYEAPLQPFGSVRQPGVVLLGLLSGRRSPVFGGINLGMPRPGAFAWSGGGIGYLNARKSLANMYQVAVPRGVRSVSERFSNGKVLPAVTAGRGAYALVLELFGAPVQPTELIGRDATGKIIARFNL